MLCYFFCLSWVTCFVTRQGLKLTPRELLLPPALPLLSLPRSAGRCPHLLQLPLLPRSISRFPPATRVPTGPQQFPCPIFYPILLPDSIHPAIVLPFFVYLQHYVGKRVFKRISIMAGFGIKHFFFYFELNL